MRLIVYFSAFIFNYYVSYVSQRADVIYATTSVIWLLVVTLYDIVRNPLMEVKLTNLDFLQNHVFTLVIFVQGPIMASFLNWILEEGNCNDNYRLGSVSKTNAFLRLSILIIPFLIYFTVLEAGIVHPTTHLSALICWSQIGLFLLFWLLGWWENYEKAVYKRSFVPREYFVLGSEKTPTTPNLSLEYKGQEASLTYHSMTEPDNPVEYVRSSFKTHVDSDDKTPDKIGNVEDEDDEDDDVKLLRLQDSFSLSKFQLFIFQIYRLLRHYGAWLIAHIFCWIWLYYTYHEIVIYKQFTEMRNIRAIYEDVYRFRRHEESMWQVSVSDATSSLLKFASFREDGMLRLSVSEFPENDSIDDDFFKTLAYSSLRQEAIVVTSITCLVIAFVLSILWVYRVFYKAKVMYTENPTDAQLTVRYLHDASPVNSFEAYLSDESKSQKGRKPRSSRRGSMTSSDGSEFSYAPSLHRRLFQPTNVAGLAHRKIVRL